MTAEAVSSATFRDAYLAIDDELAQFAITWAIDLVEQDPAWGPDRYVAPYDSVFSGFIIDMSVEGYGIVYRIADRGAAVELWYLFEFPSPPREVRLRAPAPPMM